MLINLSNHPSQNWDSKQALTAKKVFGTIKDISFPAISSNASYDEIIELAENYFIKITANFDECANTPQQNAVHIQGEFTFVFNLVTLLKNSGVRCVASTSKRNVVFNENNEKIVKFKFEKFRDY